jgi:hypothetical protein
MKSSLGARHNKRVRSKNSSSQSLKPSKRVTFPDHTYLADDLFHDLNHLHDLSCERTRGYIAVQPRRATFVRELDALTNDLYVHVRRSLREHMSHLDSIHPTVDPIASWRWAQDQVGAAIAKAMPHNPEINLSRGELALHKSAFQWTAEAFSDPRTSGLFFEDKWRAPAFMFEDETTGNQDAFATQEQTASLVNEVVAVLSSALQNARYDAFQWLLEQPRQAKPRLHRSQYKIGIVEILNHYSHASNAEIAASLDEKGTPIPEDWKSDKVTNWVSALSSDTKFHNVESMFTKVREELGFTKR